jgi:hypothetical protein
MAQEVAFEYTVRTRQKTDEDYAILVEQAPGHWIAQIRLPDGAFWTMTRSEPRAPALPKQWVGATPAAAADYAARILTNYFANEGMEVVRRRYLLETKPRNS